MPNRAVDALLRGLNIQEGTVSPTILLAGGRLGPGHPSINGCIVRVVHSEPLATAERCIELLLQPTHHAVEVGSSGVHRL